MQVKKPMSEDDASKVREVKDEGNVLFRKGQLKLAEEKYLKACDILRPLLKKGRAKESVSLWVSLRSNLCAIFVKTGKFEKGLKESMTIIDEFGDKRSRSYFRRGKCYYGLKEWTKAILDFQKVVLICQTDKENIEKNKSVVQVANLQIKKANKEIESARSLEKKMKGLFSEDFGLYEDKVVEKKDTIDRKPKTFREFYDFKKGDNYSKLFPDGMIKGFKPTEKFKKRWYGILKSNFKRRGPVEKQRKFFEGRNFESSSMKEAVVESVYPLKDSEEERIAVQLAKMYTALLLMDEDEYASKEDRLFTEEEWTKVYEKIKFVARGFGVDLLYPNKPRSEQVKMYRVFYRANYVAGGKIGKGVESAWDGLGGWMA